MPNHGVDKVKYEAAKLEKEKNKGKDKTKLKQLEKDELLITLATSHGLL